MNNSRKNEGIPRLLTPQNSPYSEGLQNIVELFAEIHERLDEVSGSLNVIATYFERKGTDEGLFTPEDLQSFSGDSEDIAGELSENE